MSHESWSADQKLQASRRMRKVWRKIYEDGKSGVKDYYAKPEASTSKEVTPNTLHRISDWKFFPHCGERLI